MRVDISRGSQSNSKYSKIECPQTDAFIGHKLMLKKIQSSQTDAATLLAKKNISNYFSLSFIIAVLRLFS